MTLRRVSIRAFALVVLCTATVSAPAEGELRSFALTNWDEDDDARFDVIAKDVRVDDLTLLADEEL